MAPPISPRQLTKASAVPATELCTWVLVKRLKSSRWAYTQAPLSAATNGSFQVVSKSPWSMVCIKPVAPLSSAAQPAASGSVRPPQWSAAGPAREDPTKPPACHQKRKVAVVPAAASWAAGPALSRRKVPTQPSMPNRMPYSAAKSRPTAQTEPMPSTRRAPECLPSPMELVLEWTIGAMSFQAALALEGLSKMMGYSMSAIAPVRRPMPK
mmetsp:Transcript_13403/g.37050  ORF Transcript_13403/g.37050 Transcript_13403/m.37050 type:complete len:211 (+) Transcript_13403:308-940(+)